MKPQARGLNFTTRRQNLNPRNNLWGWFLSDISSVLQITLLTVADFLWTYISDRKHRHKLRDNILLVWIFTNFTGIFQGRRLSFRQKSNGHLHRCFRSLPVLWNMLSFHASHISSSRKTSSHISTVEYRQLNLFLLYLNQLQNKLYIFFFSDRFWYLRKFMTSASHLKWSTFDVGGFAGKGAMVTVLIRSEQVSEKQLCVARSISRTNQPLGWK